MSIPSAKPKPRGMLRLMLRVPGLLYRLGLARRLGPRLLLLTTTGRRTGQARTVGLNYALDADVAYVVSGFGRTDWYRNLVANPRVQVQIGRDCWPGEARPVTDLEERQRARRLFLGEALRQGPPPALRPLIRRLGLDYEAEVGRFQADDLDLPIVAIRHAVPASPAAAA